MRGSCAGLCGLFCSRCVKTKDSIHDRSLMMRLVSDDALAIVTIYQEAAGEPYAGKLAVAEVIRARMRRCYASDGTVAGTVLRAWQFSGWNTDAGAVRIMSLQIDTNDPVVQECE